MVKPTLIDYHSPDVEKVWEWMPADDSDVYYLLQVDIGIEGGEGTDIFQVMVVTPTSQKSNKIDVSQNQRGYLSIENYTWEKLEFELEQIISKCKGETWIEVANCLNKRLLWEYSEHEFLE